MLTLHAVGSSGTNFLAVFGGQQSILESVLLKRKIQGPSWLSVEKPTRVESCAQVTTRLFHLT